MTVELPKDAEGREIPLDTALLYGKVSGEEYEVVCFNFRPSMRQWRVELKRRDDLGIYATESFTLSPPDSWEKLEEDLDKCIEADNSCLYYSTSGICSKCTRPDYDGGGCTTIIFNDIKKRIRKLRGEE
ncbi:hypothetical protein ACQRAJ_07760 [Collinsella sp. SGI.184]|uniref:hypothetical protein n=1 Tax=Collinsella sp. SGI.184 TaxID=3420556 RepID=UPI003D06B9E8